MDSVVALLSILTFLLLVFHRHLARRKLNLPPYAGGRLPFIGHLHLLGKLPHSALSSLAQKHGHIMSLSLGLVPAVVISDAHTTRDLFKDNDINVSDRPYFLYGEYVGYNNKNILHLPHGEKWREMRKVCSVELFTARRISSYSWVRAKELMHAFDVLLKAGDTVVNMRDVFITFTFNVITQICVGKRFFGHRDMEDDREAREFKEISTKLLFLLQKFSKISECVPGSIRWLGKLVDSSIPHFKKLHAKQDKWLNNLISEHRAVARSRECKDFMDILLEQFKGVDGEEQVKAIMMDMLVAGTDTTAIILEWAMAEIMHHPHALRKAQAEMEAVVGMGRMVEETDLPNLEYLNAVIRETLRLHSPVTLNQRMAGQDIKLAGYDIAKGTTVILNVYSISRDPQAWDNPLAFMPERFIGSSIELRGQDYAFIPFGVGRRVCPGLPMGLRTVQQILACLIHGFDWGFEPGKENEQLEEVYESVHLPKEPLKVVASPRLPAEAYCIKI